MFSHVGVCVCAHECTHAHMQRKERDGMIGECEWIKGKEKEKHRKVEIHIHTNEVCPLPLSCV